MRMFHFKQSGLGTASAVYGGVCICVCVCVFELFVWDLSGILINLVNEHHTAFCVFEFVYLPVIVIAVCCVTSVFN